MSKEPKFYVVQFSDSQKYRLDYIPGESINKRLVEIENDLRAFLKSKFPQETFAYYVTPKVNEVHADDVSRFSSLPKLDSNAVAKIKDLLLREVADMNSVRRLNSDAPYATIQAQN